MSEIEVGTFVLGNDGVVLHCPQCHTEDKVKIIDVLSIEEKPWSLPVWHCWRCSYIYSGRSKTMQNTALNFATASKKYIVDKVHGQVPSVKEMEKFNKETKLEVDPIKELKKEIRNFKLK